MYSIFQVKEIDRLVTESCRVSDEFTRKNCSIRSQVEFTLKAGRCMLISPPHSANACFFYHDPRNKRFVTADSWHYLSRPNSQLHVSDLSPKFFGSVLSNYLTLVYNSLPSSLLPFRTLYHLSYWEAATILAIINCYNIREFHVSAHFQPYVYLLNELRKAGLIDRLVGYQHGAWAKSKLDKLEYDFTFDEYTLLHPRFEKPFREYFDRKGTALVRIADGANGMRWQASGFPHIAIALQNDDLTSDLEIARNVSRFAIERGLELVIYPHPAMKSAIVKQFSELGQIRRGERFSDSACLITRYSTLGMEVSLIGGNVLFVDVGERIIFDEDNLPVYYCSIESIEKTLDSIDITNSRVSL